MSEQSNHSRDAEIEIEPEAFRKIGHELIDRIADFLKDLPQMPVSHNRNHLELRRILGEAPLPEQGTDPAVLLREATDLMFQHSVQIGHPRFWGYIIGAPAPIGTLADLLAAVINPNVGGWILSPIATEIEAQTVRWLAELIGYPSDCGGLLVSGGNMANFVPFVAARKAKAPWNVREQGMFAGEGQRLRVYVSSQTHTWIQKAADLFGLGTDSIQWVATDEAMRMDMDMLRQQIEADKQQGDVPIMVVGTAGTTAVGAIDPLPEIAALCREHDLWFHVDGAYGAPAVIADDAPAALRAIREADSVAMDPHKWLYAPLEAGAVLVRDRQALINAFAYHPDYYPDASDQIFYHEYGLQNSRGFRALKVWLGLRQVGAAGYKKLITDDIRLAQELHRLVDVHDELEALTQSLSITTFRYVPANLQGEPDAVTAYLNELNKAIVEQLHVSPMAFISNAVIKGIYALRACIVNFRTTVEDIQALPEIVITIGSELDVQMRPETLR